MDEELLQFRHKIRMLFREEIITVVDDSGTTHQLYLDTAEQKLYLMDVRGRRKKVVNVLETLTAIINSRPRHEIIVVDMKAGHQSIVIAHGWHLPPEEEKETE